MPILQTKIIKRLTKENEELQKKAKEATKRYWNARRRNLRLAKAASGRKVDLKQARIDTARLRGVMNMLGKNLEDLKETADATTSLRRVVLWKRCVRLKAAKRRLKKKMTQEKLKKHPATFRMMYKGRYTPAARSLARLMVSTGTAEAKVGSALVEIGHVLGVTVNRRMNKRSVQRFALELGVAADIQLVYEISSDSTSHKHIEYECRTIALGYRYLNQSCKPNPGRRLETASPRGFVPDDFAYRLIGTSGDHAADQKKSHEILRIWRLEVILQRLGEEAILQMDVGRVLATLISMKAKQIESYGGQAAWDALSEEERAGADALIVREIGKQVFDALPKSEQDELTRFIRTGCCMHKDLNCVKWGVKAMAEMWIRLKKTPPIILANKDNAAVLANRTGGSQPTAAEQRAEEVSKRGGVHATTLGGMIIS